MNTRNYEDLIKVSNEDLLEAMEALSSIYGIDKVKTKSTKKAKKNKETKKDVQFSNCFYHHVYFNGVIYQLHHY